MKAILMFSYLALLLLSCEKDPALWEGSSPKIVRSPLLCFFSFENERFAVDTILTFKVR